jgi:hypothetical protein
VEGLAVIEQVVDYDLVAVNHPELAVDGFEELEFFIKS